MRYYKTRHCCKLEKRQSNICKTRFFISFRNAYQLVESDTQLLNTWNYAPDSVFFEDRIYQERLPEMSKHTPFNLHYNKAVQTEINRYATLTESMCHKC